MKPKPRSKYFLITIKRLGKKELNKCKQKKQKGEENSKRKKKKDNFYFNNSKKNK